MYDRLYIPPTNTIVVKGGVRGSILTPAGRGLGPGQPSSPGPGGGKGKAGKGGAGSGSQGAQDQGITSDEVDFNISEVSVLSAQTTTSTSFTDLATVGPAVTLSSGVTQNCLLWPECSQENSNAGVHTVISVAIGGAAAADGDGPICQDPSANREFGAFWTSMGANQTSGATHTMKYRVSGNTGQFNRRYLIAVAL